jgi:hypothetical protein
MFVIPVAFFLFVPGFIYLFLFNGPNNIVFNFGPSYFVLVSNIFFLFWSLVYFLLISV